MANLGTLLGGSYSDPSPKKEKEVPAILKPRPQVSQKTLDIAEKYKENPLFDAEQLAKFLIDFSTALMTDHAKVLEEKKRKMNASPQTKVRRIGELDKSWYTTLSEDGPVRAMRNDSAANVLAKIINTMKKQHRNRTEMREIQKNFQEEQYAKEKRVLENQLKKSSENVDKKSKKIKDEKDKESFFDIIKDFFETIGATGTGFAIGFDGKGITSNETDSSTVSTVGVTDGSTREYIAARESRGNYNVMNIVGNAKDAAIEKGNVDVTTGRKFDRNLTEMTISEVIDLGNRRRAYYNKKGGEAAGKYQFVPLTLGAYAKKTFGDNWKNEKFSPENQEKLMGQFESDRNATFQKMGIPLNNETAYLYHFTGSASRVKKIIESPENTPMRSFFGASEQRENQKVMEKSVGQYRRELMSFKPRETPTKIKQEPAAKPIQASPSVNLPQLSSANKELKSILQEESSLAMVNASTNVNNIISNRNITVIQKPQPTDVPSIIAFV